MDWPHRPFELRMPSEAEQIEAREYVRTHELVRPDTSYFRALCFAMLFIVATILLAMLLHHLGGVLFSNPTLIPSLPPLIQEHAAVAWVLSGLLAFVIMVGLTGKRAAIGVVRLYQHYAPENVRRRCLFKPTCSEYAILALQKYGLIKGLYMAYERLFVRCRGNIYMRDEP